MGFKTVWDKLVALWKDDSPIGWIFSIVVIFIFIKFIFFPILSLVTGTALPLAIVESCSMYHKGDVLSDFDSWYERHDSKYEDFEIEKIDFLDFSLKKGFNKGDILFIVGTKPKKLEVGDIIIFQTNSATPIIHRIIHIKESDSDITFSTIGDNNGQQHPFEKSISENQLVGKAVFKLAPLIGWGKLIFFEHTQPESNKGFCSEN